MSVDRQLNEKKNCVNKIRVAHDKLEILNIKIGILKTTMIRERCNIEENKSCSNLGAKSALSKDLSAKIKQKVSNLSNMASSGVSLSGDINSNLNSAVDAILKEKKEIESMTERLSDLIRILNKQPSVQVIDQRVTGLTNELKEISSELEELKKNCKEILNKPLDLPPSETVFIPGPDGKPAKQVTYDQATIYAILNAFGVTELDEKYEKVYMLIYLLKILAAYYALDRANMYVKTMIEYITESIYKVIRDLSVYSSGNIIAALFGIISSRKGVILPTEAAGIQPGLAPLHKAGVNISGNEERVTVPIVPFEYTPGKNMLSHEAKRMNKG